MVIQEIPESWEEEVVKGLLNPVWDIYLGRKCCAPALPIYGGIFDSQEMAEVALQKDMSEFFGEEFMPVAFWEEVSPGTEHSMLLHDVPLVFGKHKKYTYRYVLKQVISER